MSTSTPFHLAAIVCLGAALVAAGGGCASGDEFPLGLPPPSQRPSTDARADESPRGDIFRQLKTITIPPPDLSAVEVAHGYRAEVCVGLLSNPTSITFDDRGNLFVAESGATRGEQTTPPRILRVSPAGQIDVMTEKLSPPVVRMRWMDGRLLVWQRGKVSSLDGGPTPSPWPAPAAAARSAPR